MAQLSSSSPNGNAAAAAAPPFRALEATASDIPRLMEIQFAAFASEPADQVFNGPDTPQKRAEAGARLLNQMHIDPSLHIIKAVAAATTTKTETEPTTVGFCMWSIYAHPRPEHEWMAEHEMVTCNWITPASAREKARTMVLPLLTGRRRMEGRPHALLMYMCVEPAWQRRGAGRALMNWGTAVCDELGIPAYLEATDFGLPLYRACGFEVYEPLTVVIEGKEVTYPTMLRQPWGRGEVER